MSFPNIPEVSLNLNVATEQIVNLLLASIAFEELGLAHVINAEAEKIQSVLGTLSGQTGKEPTLTDLERIDNTVNQILENVIMKEMLLLFKLENVLSITSTTTTTSSTTTSSSTTKIGYRAQ